MRKITLEQARSQYVHRYTTEHIPKWAHGTLYAPQYSTDKEWYDLAIFPGEPGLHGNCQYCQSGPESWPLGERLEKPYQLATSKGR